MITDMNKFNESFVENIDKSLKKILADGINNEHDECTHCSSDNVFMIGSYILPNGVIVFNYQQFDYLEEGYKLTVKCKLFAICKNCKKKYIQQNNKGS